MFSKFTRWLRNFFSLLIWSMFMINMVLLIHSSNMWLINIYYNCIHFIQISVNVYIIYSILNWNTLIIVIKSMTMSFHLVVMLFNTRVRVVWFWFLWMWIIGNRIVMMITNISTWNMILNIIRMLRLKIWT